MAGAHTWISESSPPHGPEPRFEDGWFAGVRDVASYLLRIADTPATTGRGRAASSTMLLAHLQQPASPAPQETPVEEPAPAVALEDLLAAAERFPWAMAAPGERHWPDGGDFLEVALSAVRPKEREGYIERLEAFVEQHRARRGGDAAHAPAGQQARLARPVRADRTARDPGHRGTDGDRPVPPARPVGEGSGDGLPGRPRVRVGPRIRLSR
ncbi:hypothetical protein [Streptomyces sp. NPDC055100]